jgi:hypothetical protein
MDLFPLSRVLRGLAQRKNLSFFIYFVPCICFFRLTGSIVDL